MSSSLQWHFEVFRLDSDNARLWRGDESVPLTLKALGVLHHLVTHAGQLVTKEALLDALWPDTAVSDAALRVVISELRKALGDTAQAPQYIATVHRLGYRFLAPVIRIARAAEGVETAPPFSAVRHTPQGPRLEERKSLTVLCYMLPSASVLGARLGLDDLARLLELMSDLTVREVQRYEGMIQHVTGDAFLALFAVPVGQENHVQ